MNEPNIVQKPAVENGVDPVVARVPGALRLCQCRECGSWLKETRAAQVFHYRRCTG